MGVKKILKRIMATVLSVCTLLGGVAVMPTVPVCAESTKVTIRFMNKDYEDKVFVVDYNSKLGNCSDFLSYENQVYAYYRKSNQSNVINGWKTLSDPTTIHIFQDKNYEYYVTANEEFIPNMVDTYIVKFEGQGQFSEDQRSGQCRSDGALYGYTRGGEDPDAGSFYEEFRVPQSENCILKFKDYIVRSGYTLQGYKINDGSKLYSASEINGMVINKDMTIVPQWKKNEDGNKSTTPSNTIPAKKDTNTKKYSNEWVDGKWYDADGTQTYKGTLAWKNDATGWWIDDGTGWYPTNSWQKIDGTWYFFKPDGYMASNEYYNGYWFNKDGSWDEKYFLSWKQNSTGWWVEDVSGWWPSSSWLKIDGYWYYFDASGYMVTSQYVDGYWISADGVCY